MSPVEDSSRELASSLYLREAERSNLMPVVMEEEDEGGIRWKDRLGFGLETRESLGPIPWGAIASKD